MGTGRTLPMRGVMSLLLTLLTLIMLVSVPRLASAQEIGAALISGEDLDTASQVVPGALLSNEADSDAMDPAFGHVASFSPGTEATGDLPVTVVAPASTSSTSPLIVRVHTPTQETNRNITTTVTVSAPGGTEFARAQLRDEELTTPVAVQQFSIPPEVLDGHLGRVDVAVEVVLRDTYGMHTHNSSRSVIIYPIEHAVGLAPVVHAPLPPLMEDDAVDAARAAAVQPLVADLGRYARSATTTGIRLTVLIPQESYQEIATIATAEEIPQGLDADLWRVAHTSLVDGVTNGTVSIVFTGRLELDAGLAADTGLTHLVLADIAAVDTSDTLVGEKVMPVIEALPRGLASDLVSAGVERVIMPAQDASRLLGATVTYGVGDPVETDGLHVLFADGTTASSEAPDAVTALEQLFAQHHKGSTLDTTPHVLSTTLSDDPHRSEAFMERMRLYLQQPWTERISVQESQAERRMALPSRALHETPETETEEDTARDRVVRLLRGAGSIRSTLAGAAIAEVAVIPLADEEMELALDIGLDATPADGDRAALAHAQAAYDLLAQRMEAIEVRTEPVVLQGASGLIPISIVDPHEERLEVRIVARGLAGIDVDGPAGMYGLAGSTTTGDNYFNIPVRLLDSEALHAVEIDVFMGDRLLDASQVEVVSRRLDIKIGVGVTGVLLIVLVFVLRSRLRAAGTSKRVEDDA